MTTSIIISVILVSIVPLVGIVLLNLADILTNRLLPYVTSFATGALLGCIFFHVLPASLAYIELEIGLPLVLAGITFSFIAERFTHWNHCQASHCGHHPNGKPVDLIMLIGDGAYNMINGVLVAAAFLAGGNQVGVATVIAIIIYGIPKKIGDHSLLIYRKFTKQKVLIWHFISMVFAVIGAAIVLYAQHNIGEIIGDFLLPIIAGYLLYIATSGLMPEANNANSKWKSMVAQIIVVLLGMVALRSVVVSEHNDHEHSHNHHEIHNEHKEQHHDHHGDIHNLEEHNEQI